MKIMSMADIHGDFEIAQRALDYISKTDARVITVQGDLSGRVLNNESERNRFFQVFQMINAILPQIYQKTQKRLSFHDAAFMLSAQNGIQVPEDLKRAALDYILLESKAKEGMSENYKRFKKMFQGLPQRVLLIPGEWDGIHIDDFLAAQNIHNKYPEEIFEKEGDATGIKFVGYGGSREQISELPYDLTFGFNEDEAYSHLSKNKNAEVALTHVTPRGFERGDSKGEYSLLAYLNGSTPSLLLMGHNHNVLVTKYAETGTIIANPGVLGRFPDAASNKMKIFGTFLEFNLKGEPENSSIIPAALHRVEGNKIETQNITEKVSQ